MIIGAIAAGNCVILKPSEIAPASANFMATVLPQYIDKECYQVILGDVPETTRLLEQRFDYIFFTGSTQVGKIIHQAAAKHLTPCTLELGGKSPVYLDDTVDMHVAVKRILWGKLLNSGQTCLSPDYLLCTKDVQEQFIQMAKQVLEEFYGQQPENSLDLSRIVTERHFKRLQAFIKPEQVALGGVMVPDKLFIGPTILINVKPNDPVMNEEIFGPILPIINVDGVDGAIEFINSRDKPLALYIFTKKKTVWRKMLKETSCGGCSVNDTIMQITVENLPFGGIGASGMGAYHGKYGFDTFTHKKSVFVKDMSMISEMSYNLLRYAPYTNSKTNLLSMVVKKRKELIGVNFVKYVTVFCFGCLFFYIIQCLV